LYRLDVRLQEEAVLRGVNGVEDFDVSEKELVGVINCVTCAVNEHIKEKGSQDRSMQNARQNIKWRGVNSGDANLGFMDDR
jgi:hypothetical protein